MALALSDFESMKKRIASKNKEAVSAPKKSKYGNKITEVDGIKFHSKLEAAFYSHLCLLKDHGKVLYFLRQVAIHLPANIRYICDFQIFYSDGSVRYVDTKGVETEVFRIKKKQVEALFPIKIELVKHI